MCAAELCAAEEFFLDKINVIVEQLDRLVKEEEEEAHRAKMQKQQQMELEARARMIAQQAATNRKVANAMATNGNRSNGNGTKLPLLSPPLLPPPPPPPNPPSVPAPSAASAEAAANFLAVQGSAESGARRSPRHDAASNSGAFPPTMPAAAAASASSSSAAATPAIPRTLLPDQPPILTAAPSSDSLLAAAHYPGADVELVRSHSDVDVCTDSGDERDHDHNHAPSTLPHPQHSAPALDHFADQQQQQQQQQVHGSNNRDRHASHLSDTLVDEQHDSFDDCEHEHEAQEQHPDDDGGVYYEHDDDPDHPQQHSADGHFVYAHPAEPAAPPAAPSLAQRMHMNLQVRLLTAQKPWKVLEKALTELYRGLHLLRNYKILQFTAFVKILKKYDKLDLHPSTLPYSKSGEGTPVPDDAGFKASAVLLPRIQSTHFLASPILKAFIRRVELIFAHTFTKGNHKAALDGLRVVPQPLSRWVIFRLGMLLGVSGVLCLVLIVLASWVSDQSASHVNLNIVVSLPIWRSLALIILHLWGWGFAV